MIAPNQNTLEDDKGTFMFKLLTTMTALLLLSGCATVIKGTTQTMPINSDPDGADVVINNVVVGLTPTEIELQRKRDHQITIRKEGYQPATVPVLKSVGGAVWGNILAGGFIGWGVDAASGAQYNLKPETVFVRLRPLQGREEVVAPDRTAEGIERLRALDDALEAGTLSNDEYAAARERVIREYFPEMIEDN
jgi:hypothetical protein